MMEGALKNLVNLNPPGAPRKRKSTGSFPVNGWYRDENGKFFSIVNKDKKPPDPMVEDFEWVWWDFDKKWIQMHNDVFEEKKTFRPKKLFKKDCCECM